MYHKVPCNLPHTSASAQTFRPLCDNCKCMASHQFRLLPHELQNTLVQLTRQQRTCFPRKRWSHLSLPHARERGFSTIQCLREAALDSEGQDLECVSPFLWIQSAEMKVAAMPNTKMPLLPKRHQMRRQHHDDFAVYKHST